MEFTIQTHFFSVPYRKEFVDQFVRDLIVEERVVVDSKTVESLP